MPSHPFHRGLTLLETAISLGLIAVLVSLLIPILSTARQASYRDQCAANQRVIGQAWQTCVEDHNKQFPHVPLQPGWFWGGVRFSSVDDLTFPDFERPLNAYLPLRQTSDYDSVCVCCPADRGISSPSASVGTGGRTAFRSFGTSYRANAALLDARLARLPPASAGEAFNEDRGLRRSEITTAPSRLVLAGDPVWFEVSESTGRVADWHGKPSSGNLLFLDGSVRFMTIHPRPYIGPMVFDPIMPGGGGGGWGGGEGGDGGGGGSANTAAWPLNFEEPSPIMPASSPSDSATPASSPADPVPPIGFRPESKPLPPVPSSTAPDVDSDSK